MDICDSHRNPCIYDSLTVTKVLLQLLLFNYSNIEFIPFHLFKMRVTLIF